MPGRIISCFLLVVIACATVSLPLAATKQTRQAQFSAALAAYNDGNFSTAFAMWSPLAEDDDPAAQRNLAHLFRHGLGVKQDFVAAVKWYRRAAVLGLVRAQANLAEMYLRGQGVERNMVESTYWFREAALQGHVIAQYRLGLFYSRGTGLPKNIKLAAYWFAKSAQANFSPAVQALKGLKLAAQAAAKKRKLKAVKSGGRN